MGHELYKTHDSKHHKARHVPNQIRWGPWEHQVLVIPSWEQQTAPYLQLPYVLVALVEEAAEMCPPGASPYESHCPPPHLPGPGDMIGETSRSLSWSA